MYSEKTYKNYIFWLQVKRIFLIIVLSSIGCALGVLIGKILESTVKLSSFNNIIIIVSTIIFFLISLLLTVGTGKQVQDGYWRIAVLRKLTVIQKNLELNNELLRNSNITVKEKVKTDIEKNENKNNDKIQDITTESTALYKVEKTALVPQKHKSKKKIAKTLKVPEGITK